MLLIIVIVFVMSISSCSKNIGIKKLKSIGYNKTEISLIRKNKVSVKILKKYEYIDNIEDFINNKNYNNKNLSKYLELWKKNSDANTIITIVNEGLKYQYSQKLVAVVNDKYFLLKNIDRYMKYDADEYKDIVSEVNSDLDKEYFEDAVDSDISDDLLLLVNKYHRISKDYYYGKLVDVDKNYSVNSSDKLSSVTYEAFKKLVDAAEKEGLHIRSKSAYRSYTTQENLYNNYKKANGFAWAEKWSAHPGYSEHQTGLALDVCSKSTGTIQKFEGTKEFTWMKDNAYKYGFILRYPEGKEKLTGYNYEPWHYRYVGKKIAKYIYENNITFEEYWAYFVDK